MKRRGFLGRGAQAGAGLLAGQLVVPARVLGRGGAVAPGERITMGFIGLGGQGCGHLLGGAWTYVPGGFVAREDVQVVAVCDVRRERRDDACRRSNEAYAGRFGQPGYAGVRAYPDFREVLARDDIDAVLLALPYHWAAPMSLLAMAAGKDVYCEKPVAVTVREARALVAAARRFGRVYQAGTQQRSEYGGKFRLAREIVRSGRLGRLTEAYAFRPPGAFHLGGAPAAERPVPDGFDWDLWLGPLPWRPYGGEAGHALPGCFVGDVNWSPHHYDVVQWVVEPDRTAPVEIMLDRPAGGGEAVVRFRYSNGVVVHSAAFPGEPVGGEGGACFVGTAGRLAVDRGRIVSYPGRIVRDALREAGGRFDRAGSHAGNFLDCVRSRRPAECEPVTAMHSMESVLTGGLALVLGRGLRWDPAGGTFPGDDEANRLLGYAARPPWQVV